MPKKLLMIAYHFPPLAGSSGIQRTLRLAQQLPRYGWQPLVLTVNARAYERTNPDLLAEIPDQAIVKRSLALDARRHLSIGGRYLAASARPDRWISWKPCGVRDALALVREHRPQAIWSTFPIATAHVIGAAVQRRTGLPWIADFRDPMAQPSYPPDPITRAQFHAIEAQTLRQARLVTVTTPSAADSYRRRYANSGARIELLENGYDEASFMGLTSRPEPLNPACITLLHSGIVYPSERDPTQLFEALARLRKLGQLTANELKLRFRAAAHDDMLSGLAERFGVADMIEIMPPIPYKAALDEMLRADGLLVLQAANCNEQIPAKIYEYLRAGKPILCLSDPAGDTCKVLMDAGVDAQCRLDSSDEIAALLPVFVAAVRAGRAALPTTEAVRKASRESRTALLAKLLDELVAPNVAC